MDRKTLNIALASVLTTLDELAPHDIPASKSIIYLALQTGLKIDYADCVEIESLLVGSGMVKATPETLNITDSGRAMAKQCNAMLAEGARPGAFASGREDD